MSAGAVHRELLAHLLRHDLDEVAQRDLLAVLEAGRAGPLDFLYATSIEAGCSPEVARARAAGSFACFSAGNLADDLADGDCTYLGEPSKTGPALVFLLLHATYGLWLDRGRVPAALAADVTRLFVHGTAQQLVEVRTEGFDLETSRRMVIGMGGEQYAAYLRIAWSGTPYEARALEIGRAIGIAGFVAEDRRSDDPRFFDLATEDRRSLVDLARRELDLAREVPLPSVDAVVRYLSPLLEGEA